MNGSERGPALEITEPRTGFLARASGWLHAVWGAVVGLAPHVLHHVGPLAGAALLGGVTGQALFAVIGVVVAIPFLRRLHRRFRTWLAPALALAVFAVAFSISTFVVGPALTEEGPGDAPSQDHPVDHGGHR